MKLSAFFNSLPKKLAASALIGLALALPVTQAMAADVSIEGTMGVANQTAGATKYTASTTAAYNDVVKIEVYYHNRELPDSGKIAQNLRVKIDIPSTAGKTQTQTATISADNTNTVTAKTTVNLDREDAYLQYLPGSAVWRHNTGTNEAPVWTDTVLSDNVASATGLVLENEKPCYNFSATVTVLARVMVPGVSVTKQVRVKGATTWATKTDAKAGDTVQYLISYKNTGNSTQSDVVVADKLPEGMTYVTGTTQLANSDMPSGKTMPDGLVGNGLVIGTYPAGINAFVMFEAKVPAEDKLACGDNVLRNIATVQPKGMNYYYNTADVNVTKTCTTNPTPSYSCDGLDVTVSDSRKAEATVKYTAKDGATYKSTTFTWGDNTADTTGTDTKASHQYAADGTYNVTAKVLMSVNGTDKYAEGGNCSKQVTVKAAKPTPTYACDLLTLTAGTNRKVTAKVDYTGKDGAKLKMVTYNWGDNSTPLVTDKTSADYTYAKDGTYSVNVKLLFNVDGTDKYAPDTANCVKSVTYTSPATPVTPAPTTPAKALPDTGAGSVIGLFGLVSVLSALAYRLVLGHRVNG